jgi:hypothetical protein
MQLVGFDSVSWQGVILFIFNDAVSTTEMHVTCRKSHGNLTQKLTVAQLIKN